VIFEFVVENTSTKNEGGICQFYDNSMLSGVYAVVVCTSFCVCVYHTLVLYQNGCQGLLPP